MVDSWTGLPGPEANRLLGALPGPELRALERGLEHVYLRRGQALNEAGGKQFVYFPISGIVSILYADEGGLAAELAHVGCEGVIGLAVLFGSRPTILRSVVQARGQAYRLRADEARACFADCRQFHAHTLRYANALMAQVAQTAVCNLHHSLEQQLCRWLLTWLDRLPGNEIEVTHELISSGLGVRRQGVTEVARRLGRDGIIAYARGRITVLDRPGLEGRACDCYRISVRETAALIGEDAGKPTALPAADVARWLPRTPS